MLVDVSTGEIIIAIYLALVLALYVYVALRWMRMTITADRREEESKRRGFPVVTKDEP